MVASAFQSFIVQPIINLLVLIYGLIPGHNFGLAIILFTIVIRLLLWPMVRKQLHQAKAMRSLQPEIKRIKEAAAGNRQKESMMLMELYKERNISPFGSFGILIIQLIILLGLYQGLSKVVHDPHAIFNYAYHWVAQLSWLQQIAHDITKFDMTLLGVIDLDRAALGPQGFYLPAMLLVIGSAVAQFYQSSQLLPQPKEKRSLRSILKDASEGKQADQTEVTEALNRNMRFLIPGLILFTTIGLPAALSLYWMVGGIVAYFQQARVLNQDADEMDAMVIDKGGKKTGKRDGTRIIIDGEVIKDTTTSSKPAKATAAKTKKSTTKPATKRRKR